MLRQFSRWRMLGAVVSLWLLVVATGGCGKKTVGPSNGTDRTPAPSPTTPQGALQVLISAYTNRDSVRTAAVYDSAYQGTSSNPAAPTPVLTFTRADEIRHVGRLKLDPSLVSVFLDFGSPTTWQVLDGNSNDPPGWKVIQITNHTVRIEDIASATTWESQNTAMEYTFKPTAVPGAPALEDTVWAIVRWTEIAN